MKTWNDYKEYIKNTSTQDYKEIKEAEELAAIIGTIIEQRHHVGLSQRDLSSLGEGPQSSIVW